MAQGLTVIAIAAGLVLFVLNVVGGGWLNGLMLWLDTWLMRIIVGAFVLAGIFAATR